MINYLKLIVRNYNELKFNNKRVIYIALRLIYHTLNNSNINITIGKSSGEQLLIYTSNTDSYTNVLIDNDGDISYMMFNVITPSKSNRKLYTNVDDGDLLNISALLKKGA